MVEMAERIAALEAAHATTDIALAEALTRIAALEQQIQGMTYGIPVAPPEPAAAAGAPADARPRGRKAQS